MSASPITLIAAGDHADAGYAIENVTDAAKLKLTFDVSAALADSILCVWLETNASGDPLATDWRELAALEATGIGAQRLVITPDSFLRVCWTARSKVATRDGIKVDHGFRWSLAGETV